MTATTRIDPAGSQSTARHALLVIGMHRSGTSALARVCSLRGARLPEHVLPANRGNETGYWEPERVVALNDRILEYFGLAWDDPFVSSRLPAVAAFPAAFLEQAQSIIREEYGDACLFVLKDPRCTLLLDFWTAALEALGVRACPVVVMRPLREVADSLVRRDATSPASAALLYVSYGLAAQRAISAGASAITYQQLVDDWRTTTDRIAAQQQFTWPRGDAAVTMEIQQFLRPPQRGTEAIAIPERLAQWAQLVWTWCSRTAEGAVVTPTDLDGVRDAVDGQAALFGAVLADRNRQRVALATAMQQADDNLRQTAGERDTALTQRDVLQQSLDTALADLLRAANQRDGALSERDEALRALEDTRARLAQTQEQFGRLEREADDLRQQLVERERQYAAIEMTLEQRHAEVLRLQGERDVVLETYRQTDARLHQTQDSYTRLDRQAQQLIAQRDRMSADIAAIHSSHSWRVTAPLRRASGFARRLLARDARPLAVYGPAGSTAGGHVLPAMGTWGDDAAPAPAAAPRAEAAEPAFERRQHPGLATFLTDEFGATAAQEVLRRIDRYRLPVDVDKVRIADQTRCSLGDAMAWAAAIAATAVPRTEDPDVSIIIPVYNQLPFTLACIDALLAHRTRYSFEILIGDDASTDATPDAFRAPIAGVRHIRHPSNLGFVRNCNATAAHARGRYVVLLNNDTQVLPGWLDELIDTLDDERIGLAGSKLVFPDGRLQECGGIVWRDGSAWNYGRMDDPRRPEYCYLRDTDYVSGAALALRRADWEEMGGFDEWYVPAYAEDVDLAFRMRARGLRTVVQPLSQLLHFEGVSSGTDLAHGAKAYQIENLRKLHQRWHAVLQDHRDNADRPDLEKERNVARRLLFVDMVTPTPNEDAGSLVAFEMMDAFRANGCKITFIPSDNFAHMGEGTRALQRKGIEAIYHPAHASMASFLASRDDAYDIIVLVRFAVGEAHLSRLRQKYPLARIIFSNCDLHYLREMREAELSGDPLAIAAAHETKRREIDVIARSDVNLVHSQAELELLEKDVPGAPCVLFPLVHDPVEHRVPLALRDGICFVGGYRHAPNADGIVWFVENIWPLVLAAAPGHTLYIAGSSMTADVRALAAHSNVQVVGFVEDLDGFLAKRRATIAPLRFGAGAKGKVAVSLANGVPVVSTSIGSEGMQLTPGVDVLVADSIVDFAAAVVDVLGDDALWQRLSDAGLAYAQRVTSRRSAHQRISDILAKIGL